LEKELEKIEKEFLALLPTNTLITMRGIKPDTPIQKAPGIFSKVLDTVTTAVVL